MTQSKRSLVTASAAAAAMVAQLVAFWRYLDRLPEDRIGLGDRNFLFEFSATPPAWSIGAAGLSLRHGLLGC
jgi:hypothetical protein